MKTFRLHRSLWLPSPPEKVFSFFQDVRNLDRITPPWLNFESLVEDSLHLKLGTLIGHRLRLRGVPIRWESEIAVWEPPLRFVDRQKKGPYRLWVHEHTFGAKDGGTVMEDNVEYAVWGGFWVNKFLIEPDLKRIFDFREQEIRKIFV